MIIPAIVCIAKLEQDYIEEFVKYHLALGFKYIYLYDNEDEPTYQKMLEKYKENVIVIHAPFNNYYKPIQYIILDHFRDTFLFNSDITHIAHIDIDEFIVLKKHKNICDFIQEYIVGDCQGIGMNWRFFGSSGKTNKTNEPVTLRFTMCEEKGNQHIKTILKKDNFLGYTDCHYPTYSYGYTATTDNKIIIGPFNHAINFDVIQLNHYKSKTLDEYRHIRKRQRADIIGDTNENIDETFKTFDINEIEDLHAYNFYKPLSLV